MAASAEPPLPDLTRVSSLLGRRWHVAPNLSIAPALIERALGVSEIQPPFSTRLPGRRRSRKCRFRRGSTGCRCGSCPEGALRHAISLAFARPCPPAAHAHRCGL